MRNFIKKTTVFSIILLSILLMTGIFFHTVHKFLPSEMYYANEFNKAFENGNFELIAIGNSKLLSAIDIEYLTKKTHLSSVMLGFSSANLSVSKLTLESYLNKCIQKPKVVLCEVSWFSFNEKRTTFHQIAGDLFIHDFKLWKNYTTYFPDINQKIKWTVNKIITSFFISTTKEKQTNYNVNFKPSSPNTKDYEFKIEKFEKIFSKHTAGINKRLLKNFWNIVKICKQNNIKLVLFSAPEDEEYSNQQKDIKTIKLIFNNAAKTENVFFLDYTLGGNLWDKQYEYWLLNSHHINEKTLFTKKLSKDLIKFVIKN